MGISLEKNKIIEEYSIIIGDVNNLYAGMMSLEKKIQNIEGKPEFISMADSNDLNYIAKCKQMIQLVKTNF